MPLFYNLGFYLPYFFAEAEGSLKAGNFKTDKLLNCDIHINLMNYSTCKIEEIPSTAWKTLPRSILLLR